MFKKLLILSLTVIALASCKKDKDDTSSTVHLSAKIDGVSTNFNTTVSAVKYDNGNNITIIGVGGSASQLYPAFVIDITSDQPITAKTYSASPNYDVDIQYAISSSELFESDNDFTVNVTSISATEIKGTFSGKITDGSAVKNITEGSFYAKF